MSGSQTHRVRPLSLIGRGTHVIACLRANGQLNFKSIEPSLAEIKEKRETSAKKVAKKQMAQSDVKTRSRMFSSIQCPNCLRKFCEQAADKHIKYCHERSKIIQNSPSVNKLNILKQTSRTSSPKNKSARPHYKQQNNKQLLFNQSIDINHLDETVQPSQTPTKLPVEETRAKNLLTNPKQIDFKKIQAKVNTGLDDISRNSANQ